MAIRTEVISSSWLKCSVAPSVFRLTVHHAHTNFCVQQAYCFLYMWSTQASKALRSNHVITYNLAQGIPLLSNKTTKQIHSICCISMSLPLTSVIFLIYYSTSFILYKRLFSCWYSSVKSFFRVLFDRISSDKGILHCSREAAYCENCLWCERDVQRQRICRQCLNPLNPELNPICYFWHY